MKEVFISPTHHFYKLSKVPADLLIVMYMIFVDKAKKNESFVEQLYCYVTSYSNAELLSTTPELLFVSLLSVWINRFAEIVFAFLVALTSHQHFSKRSFAVLVEKCFRYFRLLTRCAEILGAQCQPIFFNFMELMGHINNTASLWSYESITKPWLPQRTVQPLGCNNISTMLGTVKADITLNTAPDIQLYSAWAGSEERMKAMIERACETPDAPLTRKLALNLLALKEDAHRPEFYTAHRHEPLPSYTPKLKLDDIDTDWPDIT
jgi:hypothetical protein